MPNEKEWLTVKEAATKIGVGPITIRRAINKGELRAAKIGGRTGFRISQQALKDYMDKKSEVPAA